MYIPPLVTARINAQMKELSIGDVIDLAAMPTLNNEAGVLHSVKRVVAETNVPVETWTVQELYAALLHYHTHAINGGQALVLDADTGADLSVYVLEDQDYPLQKIGRQVVADDLKYEFELDSESDSPDLLKMLPLTGASAVAIERCVLNGQVKGVTDKREAWCIACAAAQIHARDFEWSWLDEQHVSIDAYIHENIQRILSMAVSDYAALMLAFEQGLLALDHIVRLRVFDDGFALMPVKGGEVYAPYRFCFDAVIPYGALEVWARDEEPIGHDAA